MNVKKDIITIMEFVKVVPLNLLVKLVLMLTLVPLVI